MVLLSNIRDLLTTFSPSWEFFAISSGDGRIKIWDTVKGQVQTEFADLTSNEGTDLYSKSQTGHLSLDYSCMKWLLIKRKKKADRSLLALGTGSGDVLALDVVVGDLKWRFNDCHPGGVNAISFATRSSCIYTAGVDGMVCQIDYMSGSLLQKFKASTKAISSMAISSDGSMLATAASQLKIFNSSDNKKIQKFSGHPGAVRCMIYTEDGKYVLSSSVGERYIAIWKVDGSKKQSASCVLSMEHPAVFLHSKFNKNNGINDVGFYVLAISELGLCYFWYGKDLEELRNSKPTKISLSSEEHRSKSHKGALPLIFSAELQGIVKPGSVQVLFAYGSLVKPSFQRILVQYGTDIMLSSTQDGILLPMGQSQKYTKTQVVQTEVTALDRANAEDALLPIAKIYDSHQKKRRHDHSSTETKDVMAHDLVDRGQAMQLDIKDQETDEEGNMAAICVEERLRSLEILNNKDEPNIDRYPRIVNQLAMNSTLFKDSLFEATIPQKKIKAAIKSLPSHDAYTLLAVLVSMWKSRSGSGKYVLPWIYSILVYHSDYVISQKQSFEMLDSIYKMVESKRVAIQPLLQLAGRMQLIKAQINKAGQNNTQVSAHSDQLDERESESESEDEDIDELVYGEEDDDDSSLSGSE
ncbi:hypothetical protein IFM89_008238 [Coptis chinensis]|uniref:Small-subunit processome Utp12 domain-containing protein n=1 Tax=Coptis chinensis TaxID=261450 RepID=A0A835ICP3_9MAGN|nr:hypothetical protein IFM89_008238 [Coptis chinensis]